MVASRTLLSSIRSSCPCRSIRARLAVVSSTRLIWIRGYLRAKSAISEGRIQEENKLLPPRVSVPFFRSPQSFANPSNSFWILFIFSTALIYCTPHSVRESGLVLRSKIGYPMCCSTRFTLALSEGCEINNFSAALEKLFSR